MTATSLILSIPKIPRISLRAVVLLGTGFVVFLLAFYIFQINEITRANFLLANSEKGIGELSQENKNLELTLSQKNSLLTLETILQESNFEKTDKIHYIQLLAGTVAAKPR